MSHPNNIYDRLLSKQEQMADDISEIKVILARQEESLRFHIKRTELAEEAIQINRAQLDASLKQLDIDLLPVKKHVDLVNAGFKIVSGLGVLVAIIVGIIKIIKFVL